MNVEEIDQRLKAAMPLRVPMFNPSDAPRTKITALEEYMRTCAYQRAELEEALHWAWEAQKHLKQRWAAVQGYEAMLGRSPTQADINRAKRDIAPEVAVGLHDVADLLRSLERQIKRLSMDETSVSRSFTMLTA